jgi:hypothetical protein
MVVFLLGCSFLPFCGFAHAPQAELVDGAACCGAVREFIT